MSSRKSNVRLQAAVSYPKIEKSNAPCKFLTLEKHVASLTPYQNEKQEYSPGWVVAHSFSSMPCRAGAAPPNPGPSRHSGYCHIHLVYALRVVLLSRHDATTRELQSRDGRTDERTNAHKPDTHRTRFTLSSYTRLEDCRRYLTRAYRAQKYVISIQTSDRHALTAGSRDRPFLLNGARAHLRVRTNPAAYATQANSVVTLRNTVLKYLFRYITDLD